MSTIKLASKLARTWYVLCQGYDVCLVTHPIGGCIFLPTCGIASAFPNLGVPANTGTPRFHADSLVSNLDRDSMEWRAGMPKVAAQ